MVDDDVDSSIKSGGWCERIDLVARKGKFRIAIKYNHH
jgi:hypothetical protein